MVPSGIGTVSDTTAATRFAQSDAGILGFAIFFEDRPAQSGSTISVSENDVLESIGYTALNRNKTTGFVSSHLTTFKAIIKNMSAVWVNTNDGSGNLQSTQQTALPNILNEAPTSGDCNGLIYSLELAQDLSLKPFGSSQPITPVNAYIGLYNAAPGTLWFNSTGNSPNGNAYLSNNFAVPRYGGGTATWYFYGQNGVTLKPNANGLY